MLSFMQIWGFLPLWYRYSSLIKWLLLHTTIFHGKTTEITDSRRLTNSILKGLLDRKGNNIIEMAHDNDGHVLIEYDQETITLKLLFKQMAGKTGNDDDNNNRNHLTNKDVTSLSNL